MGTVHKPIALGACAAEKEEIHDDMCKTPVKVMKPEANFKGPILCTSSDNYFSSPTPEEQPHVIDYAKKTLHLQENSIFSPGRVEPTPGKGSLTWERHQSSS